MLLTERALLKFNIPTYSRYFMKMQRSVAVFSSIQRISTGITCVSISSQNSLQNVPLMLFAFENSVSERNTYATHITAVVQCGLPRKISTLLYVHNGVTSRHTNLVNCVSNLLFKPVLVFRKRSDELKTFLLQRAQKEIFCVANNLISLASN